MNMVDMVLATTTLFSLATAGIMVWYVRKLLVKMTILADMQQETVEEIVEYSTHLNTVYEMETFYGDETLRALLEHTGNLSDSLQTKISSVSFIEEATEEDDDDDSTAE